MSLAAIGRLVESRATLVELLALLPDEPTPLRVKLIGACAMLEHLLGHHKDAHQRLLSAHGGCGTAAARSPSR